MVVEQKFRFPVCHTISLIEFAGTGWGTTEVV